MRFVLATLTTNAWVLLLPWWIAPFALVGAVLGAWRAPLVVRLPVLGYFGVFAIVGLPFNWYWGWIPGMLLPLAWVHLPTSFPRRRRSGPVQAGTRTPLVNTTVAAAVRTGG